MSVSPRQKAPGRGAVSWRAAASGFTLLEILVAFVIMALSLAVLFRGMAASLRATSVAGRYEEALSRAQSHLEAISAPGMRVDPRSEQGDEAGGFSWSLRIAPLRTATAIRQSTAQQPGPRLTLYAATVTESWKGIAATSGQADRGAVRLSTQLLGAPPP